MARLPSGYGALAGALLAVAVQEGAGSPVVEFYGTALAVAVMLGAAFAAYLDAAERRTWPAYGSLVCAVAAGALLMIDATLRFPLLAAGGAPDHGDSLAGAALVVSLAGAGAAAVEQLLAIPPSWLPAGLRRRPWESPQAPDPPR